MADVVRTDFRPERTLAGGTHPPSGKASPKLYGIVGDLSVAVSQDYSSREPVSTVLIVQLVDGASSTVASLPSDQKGSADVIQVADAVLATLRLTSSLSRKQAKLRPLSRWRSILENYWYLVRR